MKNKRKEEIIDFLVATALIMAVAGGAALAFSFITISILPNSLVNTTTSIHWNSSHQIVGGLCINHYYNINNITNCTQFSEVCVTPYNITNITNCTQFSNPSVRVYCRDVKAGIIPSRYCYA